ncbi:MAG: tetratricopeptide repeat protein, partial [Candidatus Marinimicrobia bacterium]|nr:tetratricopeptide repeat protein [Candidatus Neomarinimicrobiota bacterium]
LTALKALLDRQEQIQKQGTSISTDIEADPLAVWRTIADIHFRLGQWQDAANAYQTCLNDNLNSENVLKQYFKTLEKLEDWPTALDVLGKLIQLTGESPMYLNAIGTILLRMQEYEAALQTYLQLNRLQPEVIETRRKIASLYAKTGKLDEAQKWLL